MYIRIVYRQDYVIHIFVTNIMTLLFLPAQHIQSMFVRIESLVPPNGKLCELINYVCQSNIQCSLPTVGQCTTSLSVSAITGRGRFGTVLFTFPIVPVCTVYVLFLTSVHRENPLDIILLLIHLIMQILCQVSINYLLQVNAEKKQYNALIS